MNSSENRFARDDVFEEQALFQSFKIMCLIVSFEVLLYVKICFINNVLSSVFNLTIIFEECCAETVNVKNKAIM